MSSLIFVGLFSLRGRHIVETSFTKCTGEKGTISHAYYDMAVIWRHPSHLPAKLRIYTHGGELIPNDTVAIVIAKGYVPPPPPDVAGDLFLDTLYIAPFLGTPTGDYGI